MWRYDPAANSWTLVYADLPFTPRQGMAATLHNGQFYLFGGEDENGNPLSDAWRCDPAANSWELIAGAAADPAAAVPLLGPLGLGVLALLLGIAARRRFKAP